MIYLDTSVAVPIFVPEASSEIVSAWLDESGRDLVSADWILTEFASALFLKVRLGHLAQNYAHSALAAFEIFSRSGLRLSPVTRATFARGAQLIGKAEGALRAGDALHLAMALELGATCVATADDQFEHSATANGLDVKRF